MNCATDWRRLTQEDDPFILLSLEYLDGNIEAEDLRRLEALLRSSQERRKVFVHLCLHRRLMLESYGKSLRDASDSSMGEDEDALLALQMLREQEMEVPTHLVELDEQARQTGQHRSKTSAPASQPVDTSGDGRREDGTLFTFAGISIYRTTRGDRPVGRTISLRKWAVAAVIAVAAMGSWLLWQPLDSTVTQPPTPVEQAPRVVATLTQMYAARWEDAAGLHRGATLQEGHRLSLRSGYAALTMGRGATVVLEGPCDLVLQDDNTVRLERGKLVAHVPEQARQFAVNAPFAEIIDLGTEFGVEVLEDGTSNVHVFEGVVELGPREAEQGGERLLVEQFQSAFADSQAIQYDESLVDKLRFMRFANDTFGDFIQFDRQQIESAWHINGHAQVIPNGVRLTPAGERQRVGTMFARRPIRFDRNMSFRASFVVQMSDPDVHPDGTATPAIGIGGDGMVFVMHTNPEALTTAGRSGHHIGVDHLSPAVALVLDTWSFQDEEYNEPDGEYVGLRLHGNVKNEVAQRVPFLLNDGSPVYVWLEYLASRRTLRCYVSKYPQRPDTPTLVANLDLHEVLARPESVYIGFSASTGNAWQNQDVLDVQMQTLFE